MSGCSLMLPAQGSASIRRNPEGKWRKGPEDLARLALTQRRCLKAAATCVARGGVLLYATCSTREMENEEVVDDFLPNGRDLCWNTEEALFPGMGGLFTEQGMFRSWPHRHGGMDGFFAAAENKLIGFTWRL